MRYEWYRRHANGYEVSSKGDKRFSAFYARMPDGRSIEDHYQCDVKGYPSWRDGKGKPPLRVCNLWAEYLHLWRVWASHNPQLMQELAVHPILTDMFCKTPVNQAHALATLLNERAV